MDENIRDWCISRQLWWGHRIPAWHCGACAAITVARSAPEKCPRCGGAVEQDPDTLDTWFSSALWPISTLGWPDEAEMKRLGFHVFYPTSVLVTAADIIFLWVARMAMAGLKFAGKVPFRTVVFNSLITDPEGKKMSKTKGNVVDPLDLFGEFGTDAVRFTLTGQETLKQSFRMSENKVEHGRNFMNKIWNAARFILPNLEGFRPSAEPPANRTLADRWILSRLQGAVEAANASLGSYNFNEYAGGLEDFFWHDFCDTYVELAKPALRNPSHREAARWTLWRILDDSMRLLHPVIPFITEEIWQRLPHLDGAGKLLMLEQFPRASARFRDAEADELLAVATLFVRNIRILRHEQDIPLKAVPEIHVLATDANARVKLDKIGAALEYIESLCRAKITPLAGDSDGDSRPGVTTVFSGFTVCLKLESAADTALEQKRLGKELGELEVLLERTEGLLSNKEYAAKAPATLVAETKAKAEDYRARIGRLKGRLEEMKRPEPLFEGSPT